MSNWVKTANGSRVNLDLTVALRIDGYPTYSVTAHLADGSLIVMAEGLASVAAAQDFTDNLLLDGS